jgi:hypothetical protein
MHLDAIKFTEFEGEPREWSLAETIIALVIS